MSVIPDKITPELGWRTWQISNKHGLTLRSTAASAVWLPGEIMCARCDPQLSPLRFTAPHYPNYRWIVTDRGDSSCYRLANAGEQISQPFVGYGFPQPPRVALPHGLCYGLIDASQPQAMPSHGDPPGDNCGCGIYALSSLDHLVEQFGISAAGDEEVIGRVSLWGKVIPGDHGWRAQFAYPAEFFLLAPTGNHGGIWRRRRRKETDEIAEKLEAWNVPVHVFENRDELLALGEAA